MTNWQQLQRQPAHAQQHVVKLYADGGCALLCCAGPCHAVLCYAANPTKEMRLQWQQEAKEK